METKCFALRCILACGLVSHSLAQAAKTMPLPIVPTMQDKASAEHDAALVTQAGLPAAYTRVIPRDWKERHATLHDRLVCVLPDPVTLPDGYTIPANSILEAEIVEMQHTDKAHPNGGIVLLFNKLKVKGREDVDAFAVIEAVQSVDDYLHIETAALGRGGFRASRGPGSIGSGNTLKPVEIRELLLLRSPQSSGALLRSGDELYLHSTIQFAVVLGRGPVVASTARALAAIGPPAK